MKTTIQGLNLISIFVINWKFRNFYHVATISLQTRVTLLQTDLAIQRIHYHKIRQKILSDRGVSR